MRLLMSAFLAGFLMLLTTPASAQPVPLNVGFIKLTDNALVESFPGIIGTDTVVEVQEALNAALKIALHDLTTEAVLPQYNLTLVTATMENNTYSDMYNAATQLIQQKVAVLIILIGTTDFVQYLSAIAEGFRVPVLTFSCRLAARQDESCLSSSVRGETALQFFSAAQRLGFKRSVYIYNPNVIDSSLVETFATEMSGDIQIQTIQARTDINNATIQEILNSRVSAVIIGGPTGLAAYRAIRAAVGAERAKYCNFLAPFAGLTVNQIWSTFGEQIGQEDGLFTVEAVTPAALQLAYADRVIKEGWANTTNKKVALLTSVLQVTSYRYYNMLRMWGYGFQKLVTGQPAGLIASSMGARPKISRQVYYGNDTINSALGVRVRNVSGIPILFSRFAVSRPNLTEFNRTQPLWTQSCKKFIGFVDDPGFVTNATFADGSNIAPAKVPLRIKGLSSSSIHIAGFSLAGIIISFNILLFGLLVGLRASPSIKSASWVFMGTTLVGSICLAITLFLTTADPTAAQCSATPALISVGLHLILVSIAVKAFRLSIIFHNRYNRRIVLRDEKLAIMVVAFYIPDVILLAVWLSTYPLKAIYVEEGGEWQTPKCYSNAPGFPWGLFGYGLAKLLFALRYTYLTRNVYTRYNETKAVLFAVYNVLIGLVLGLVSYAITGLQREGAIILLLIALAVASFGTSASVVGSRVVYALVDITSSKPRTSTGSAGSAGIKNDSGSYEQDPQILVRRGLKALPDVSMAKTGNSEPIPTNSNDGSKKKDDDYVCQGDLIGYEASVRQRSVVLWLSKWYSCLVIIGNVNTEPNIIISIYEDITGSGKLVPTRTMTLIGEQVGDVVFLEKNTVKIDTTRGVFDVDFPSASLAAQFVEAYQKRMGKPKFDNKSSAPDTKESGGEVV